MASDSRHDSRPAVAAGLINPSVLARTTRHRASAQVGPRDSWSPQRAYRCLSDAADHVDSPRFAKRPVRLLETPAYKKPLARVWTDGGSSSGRDTGERPAVAVWTAVQLAAFLTAVADDSLHAMWWLVGLRGLRRGEACGLRWSEDSSILTTADTYTSVLPPKQRRVAEATARLVLAAASRTRKKIKATARRNRPPTATPTGAPTPTRPRKSTKPQVSDLATINKRRAGGPRPGPHEPPIVHTEHDECLYCLLRVRARRDSNSQPSDP
jgi:integrase